mgnify:CR=1 FL=1
MEREGIYYLGTSLALSNLLLGSTFFLGRGFGGDGDLEKQLGFFLVAPLP